MIITKYDKLEENRKLLEGAVSLQFYSTGEIKSCILNEYNKLGTKHGDLVPQYGNFEYGERQKKYRSSITFHANGEPKNVALDNDALGINCES